MRTLENPATSDDRRSLEKTVGGHCKVLDYPIIGADERSLQKNVIEYCK